MRQLFHLRHHRHLRRRRHLRHLHLRRHRRRHPPKEIILRGINYDFDQSSVKLDFEPVLDEAASILSDNPDVNVLIEGHTDSIGSEAYNQSLSDDRAEAVKVYLVGKGVGAERLETVGRGESDPVAPNTNDDGTDNPEGRAMNRRAELIVQ